MRPYSTMRLAALGLAMLAPAVARADEPTGLDGEPMPAPAPASAPAPKSMKIVASTPRKRLFARSETVMVNGVTMPRRINAGAGSPPVMAMSTMPEATPGCASCQVAANADAGGMIVATVPMATEAPGHASVGPKQAAGSARVGGAVSAEPEPMGVMQTNYNAGGPAPMGGGMSAPGRASVGGGGGGLPSQSGPIRPPVHNRPRIIGHLFGLPNFGTLSAEQQARKQSAHAAIRYDNLSPTVNELPSSMVYGR